jgi:hypothetical protein
MTGAMGGPSFQEAFRYRGCPICLRLDKDEYDFMCSLQGKTLKDEKVRQDLVSSNGYCNFHFHEMARLTSPLVNAVIAEELIDREIREIEEGSFPSLGRIDCPVCGFLGQRESFYLEEFVILLQESSAQREYEETDGLCQVHIKKILTVLEGNELNQYFLHTQLRQVKRLKGELQDFISKGRGASRRMGREKNSWWVAIQKRVGKRGLPKSS